jgi:hypothetical protein
MFLLVQRRNSRRSSSAHRLTVERALNRRNTGEAETRAALIVAITLAFTIDAEGANEGRPNLSRGSLQAAGNVRVETLARV